MTPQSPCHWASLPTATASQAVLTGGWVDAVGRELRIHLVEGDHMARLRGLGHGLLGQYIHVW